VRAPSAHAELQCHLNLFRHALANASQVAGAGDLAAPNTTAATTKVLDGVKTSIRCPYLSNHDIELQVHTIYLVRMLSHGTLYPLKVTQVQNRPLLLLLPLTCTVPSTHKG
jgi:hypothetical protein